MRSSVEDIFNLNNYFNTGGSSDFLPVLGAAAGLGLLFAVWAIFIRRRPKAGAYTLHEGALERRRKRRSRNAARRNPTLAETGGLPPARPDQQIKV